MVPHARSLIPSGLRVLPDQPGLPSLGTIEFALTTGRTTARGPARVLAQAVLADAFRLQRAPERAEP